MSRGTSRTISCSNVPDRATRIHVQCFRYRDELDDIDATLAALIFGYEALRFVEAVGELLLRQAGLLARGDQQLQQADMSG